MDLSILIVSFNTKRLLRNCLESIFGQTKGINYEVIVVDNGSRDGSKEYIKNQILKSKNTNQKSKIIGIFNRKNLGFAAANNQGIKIAQGEYVLLLNSDTILKDNPFLKLIQFAKKHPQAGVIGCKLLNRDGSDQPSTAPFFTLPYAFLWLFTGDRFLYSSPQKASQVDWVMGAALMAKKEAIEKVGLLDEKFFMYMEEVEWCYRFKKAGWQVWFYPGAEIYHLVRGSSPEGRQKAIDWIHRGLIYFYQKHFAPWQLSVLKLLLRTKALGAKIYAKAFKMV